MQTFASMRGLAGDDVRAPCDDQPSHCDALADARILVPSMIGLCRCQQLGLAEVLLTNHPSRDHHEGSKRHHGDVLAASVAWEALSAQ